MRSIQELTGKFTMETRQAMFGATVDAVQRNESAARCSYAAANLLRTSTLRELMAAANIQLEPLLRDLDADPPGESAYDAFQHLIQAGASLPQDASEEQKASVLSHPAMHKLPRACVPTPTTSTPSWARTSNVTARPFTDVTTAVAVTPTGVAARWRTFTSVPTETWPGGRWGAMALAAATSIR